MAIDLTFPVREAVVAFLRADGSVTALIQAARIYGQMQPPNVPYPFVRCGQPSAVPLDYSCQDGATITLDLHTFSQDEYEAEAIGREIITSLDGKRISLDGGGSFDARWTGSQSLRDPVEPDIWHKLTTFDFEAGK